MNTPTVQNGQAEQKGVQRVILRRIVLLLLLLFLVVYLISVIYTATDFFAQSAQSNALVQISADVHAAEDLLQLHYDNLQEVAQRLAQATTKAQVDAVVSSYVGSAAFGDLRYYAGTQSFDSSGVLVPGEVDDEIELLAAARTKGAVLFFDNVVQQDCVAFFLPVERTSFADSVISVVPVRDRETGALLLDFSNVLSEGASAIALIGNDRILLSATAGGFEMTGSDVQSFLLDFTAVKEDGAAVIDALHRGEMYTRPVQSLSGEQFTVSCAPIDALGEDAMLIGISKNEVLIASEMLFIRHMVALLIVASAAFVTVLVYSVLYHRQAKKALSTAILTDASIECPNAEQFRRTMIDIVYSQKRSCALLYYQLKRHRHIVEMLGEQKTTEVFRFVAKVFDSFCTVGETYGYAGDGNFLLLNHYQSEKQLGEKVRLLEAVINKSELVKEYGVAIKFNVGVYLPSQGKRRTVPQMIECAMMAAQSAKSDMTKRYVLYTEEVDTQIATNERIEAQMEEALSNGEFKLFLQPKYNVARDCIDSAEALVRWFDPERGEYRFPAAFIGLFETNGFIIKLDQFIYLEVLKYMSHAAERGERIVPISVNVSRVTAMDDDFLNFYIGNKKKYQIGDQFITLELTESFAMENYERLFEIVRKLHENGIRCSIDDFGLGYSSFNIIKQIPIDELKIDRLFLEQGLSRDRDDKIIQTVVQLARDIQVDIVQEGVETEEMFHRVVAMGIGVIQGYYYAKAISLEEYRIFLKSNTSIKYKAKVK